MHYKCPICSSMKKPKVIKYLPLLTVRCTDCSHEDQEKQFIHQEKTKYRLL